VRCRLTKKAEPPPTRGVNRDSGTASANGGWLQRLVRQQRREIHNQIRQIRTLTERKAPLRSIRTAKREPTQNELSAMFSSEPNCSNLRQANQACKVSNQSCCLTKKAEPPPTRGVNRDSGTASANGGWLRRLVRHHGYGQTFCVKQIRSLPAPKMRRQHQVTNKNIWPQRWLAYIVLYSNLRMRHTK